MPPNMDSQQFCLTWNNHQKNLTQVFSNLWLTQALTDCMLACEGKFIKAHKVILAACSDYFESTFANYGTGENVRDTVIILRDTRYNDLCSVLEFMYYGEVKVSQAELKSVLATAEALKVKGLAEISVPQLNTALRGPGMAAMATQSLGGPIPVKVVRPKMAPPILPKNDAKDPLACGPATSQTGENSNGDPSGDVQPADNDASPPNSEEDMVVDEPAPNENDTTDPLDSSPFMDEEPELVTGDLAEDADADDAGDGDGVENGLHLASILTPSVTFSEGKKPFDPLMSRSAGGSQSNSSPAGPMNVNVIKIEDYVRERKGNRTEFWDLPSTRHVMEMISRNQIDMKRASEILGTSYALLYSKYRELYGYLKQPSVSKQQQQMQIAPNPTIPFPYQPRAGMALGGPSSSTIQRAPRKRVAIDWADAKVQNVCEMIASRQISIKKGSEILGIDYSTLYYHLVRNSPGKATMKQGRKSVPNEGPPV